LAEISLKAERQRKRASVWAGAKPLSRTSAWPPLAGAGRARNERKRWHFAKQVRLWAAPAAVGWHAASRRWMSRGRRGEGKWHRRGLAVVACGQGKVCRRCSRSPAGKKAGRSEPGGRGVVLKCKRGKPLCPASPMPSCLSAARWFRGSVPIGGGVSGG